MDKEILDELRKLNTNISLILDILNSTNKAGVSRLVEALEHKNYDIEAEITSRISQARKKAQDQTSPLTASAYGKGI